MRPTEEHISAFPVSAEQCGAAAPKQGKRVLVTGASGLLGRQVYKLLEEGNWTVRGLYSTRYHDRLVRCDLTKEAELEKQFRDFSPDVVVHLAAERRPDVCHKNTSDAQVLNVDVTQSVVKNCIKFNAWMLYLSTDYVFDGTSPPYAVDATPNPLSEYGEQKLQAEQVTLKQSPTSAVLRVPLLYGQMEHFKESGVTALYPDLKSGAMTKAEHTQKRYPTYTSDVARVIVKMLEVHCDDKPIEGIFHWQSVECLTKFDMVQLMAELTQIDASAVLPDTSPPKFPLPQDTRLDCSKLIQVLGIDPAEFRTPIRTALLASFNEYAIGTGGYLPAASQEAPTAKSTHSSGTQDDAAGAPATKIVRLNPPSEWPTVCKSPLDLGDKIIEDPSKCVAVA